MALFGACIHNPPDHEIQYLIEKSGAVAGVVSNGPLHDRLSALTSNVQFSTYVTTDDTKLMFAQIVDQFAVDGHHDPDELYALIATSGTNGLPKLVSLTQNNLQVNVTSILRVLEEANLAEPHRFLSFCHLRMLMSIWLAFIFLYTLAVRFFTARAR